MPASPGVGVGGGSKGKAAELNISPVLRCKQANRQTHNGASFVSKQVTF